MAANTLRSADVEKKTVLQQLAQLEMKYEKLQYVVCWFIIGMQGARIRKRTSWPCVQ